MESRLWKIICSNWRILLIVFIPALMIYSLANLFTPAVDTVKNGQVDLSRTNFAHHKLVRLGGQWEFYWDQLLGPGDFNSDQKTQMNTFMKVPGAWSDNGGSHYTRKGIATYRVSMSYPETLKDPALRIQNVANSYRLYVNGKLTAEVGNALDNNKDIKNDDKILIVDLPKNSQHVSLIVQVANLDCATGGLRVTPVFGSKQVLEQQRMMMIILQMLFIGGVFIIGVHYFFLFFLQKNNKSALLFSLFCFITVLRSSIWGESPLLIVFPSVSLDMRMYINYLTGYNYVAIVIFFVHSIFPLDYRKRITGLIVFPSIIFDVLLLVKGPQFMTFYTNSLYILLLLQMIYMMGILMKSVLRKRDHAILMFLTICVLIWAMNEDILNFLMIGNIHLSCMFLLGNFAVIMCMSYVQAKQQAMNHKKLILYNEKLLEADRLKDQIMATEMSFLQAQIKPHFLYNALSAIANVCEKDGKQAGKLIVDLALYLRGSLEFNNIDKMATIEKELEFVDTYFHIEQARFGQKIQFNKEILIPLDIQIPALILQPLVENAVRHGISKNPNGGTVTVRMSQNEEHITIEIEDDGIGIKEDKRATLLDGSSRGKGVGLLNIHNRLLKLYGKGLEISSTEGHTCVKISIPEVL